MSITPELKKLDDYSWEIPRESRAGMRVPGRIFANEGLLEAADREQALEQVMNVACLPGIVEASLAMPDIHWGYGFPIGGVAAIDARDGVISPGGVGYDISCGVRLIRTNLRYEEVAPRTKELLAACAARVPRGLGSRGRLNLDRRETEKIVHEGVPALVARGIGWEEDLEFIEEGGAYEGADPSKVSERAFERARNQVGTLGSGNHFLEIQVVDEVYSQRAGILGLEPGQVVVMIHSGSRGLGHQVCTDYIKRMGQSLNRYGIELPDRQLVCAPVDSPEGRDYLAAMACAANFALANREAHDRVGTGDLRGDLPGRGAAAGDEPGLRHIAQPGQAGTARDGRQGEGADGAPQGGHAGLPRQPAGGAGPLSGDRPAGDYPGGHGELLLRAGRHRRQAHGAELRLHLPRSRPHHEPVAGEKADTGGRTAETGWSGTAFWWTRPLRAAWRRKPPRPIRIYAGSPGSAKGRASR